MDRTANVARTPHGKDNVNRLRVPEFGVKKLSLRASAKASKSYQPAGAGNPPDENGGTDDFHFAPEKETVELCYELEDPLGAIEGARLELFCRYKKDPLWTLDMAALGATFWAHGQHTVKWDGRVFKAVGEQKGTPQNGGFEHDFTKIDVDTSLAPFPDGYVNLEHTTYKLKLTVSGRGVTGDPTTAWTYFHILVEKLELEYGPEQVLPAPAPGKGNHREVLNALLTQGAAPPAPTAAAPVKVYLESNVYKRNAKQMFDNTLYTEYEGLWGKGPLIPIFAKVLILDSQDKGVDAPKALGKVKFLWDWESKREALATGWHGDAFVNDAQDFDKDKTKPKGQNCHQERGGKRGTGATAVFPPQAGYAPKDTLDDGIFPFKVEPVPDKRKWAAYSHAWSDKKLAGRTGVLFQPSRMAGDAYTVSVYLAWEVDESGKNTLDVEDDAPLKVPEPKRVKAETGLLEVWRKTHLRKYLMKRAAGVPALNLGQISGCYTDAFMQLEDVSGGASVMDGATWNAGIVNATAAWNDVEKLLIDPAVDQHNIGPEGVHFRTRDQFILEWKKKAIRDREIGIGVAAAHATAIANAAAAEATAAGANLRAQQVALGYGYGAADQVHIGNEAQAGWDFVENFMSNPAKNLDTNTKYAEWLQGKAIDILISLFDGQFAPAEGVTIFQTEQSHNLTGHQASYTIGLAHDFASVAATPTRCGFLLMCRAGVVPCGLEKISAHEIGHHYFLPHPLDTAEMTDYKAHDQITPSQCLMSYNFNLQMNLCGFCQLRLRGWDKSKLDPNGPANKRT